MRNLLLLAMIFAISFTAVAQNLTGKVIEGNTFNSKKMGKEIDYSVYLPPDYESSARRYPVVYLLHGYTDNNIAWVQFGEVNRIADKGIKSGKIPPMIIVMPDAGVTWYINDYKHKEPYEDMFINEFIPYIDATYKTRAEAQFRGVSGLSMGGFGSLVFAMRHPEMFAACAPLSAAVYSDKTMMETKWYDRAFAQLYGEGLEGKKRINEHFKKYSPFHIVETQDISKLKQIGWYFDCGDDDFLLQDNVDLYGIFIDKGLNAQLRVRDGKHSWIYWRTGIGDALHFIGEVFHR